MQFFMLAFLRNRGRIRIKIFKRCRCINWLNAGCAQNCDESFVNKTFFQIGFPFNEGIYSSNLTDYGLINKTEWKILKY